MNRDERGNWYLLTGLVLGAILGVFYAWKVRPLQYTDTSPASLRQDYKDSYRALIASAYLANGDLVRARARLELLKDSDMSAALNGQAQRNLANGTNLEEARALGILAVALGSPGAAPVLAVPATTPAPAPGSGAPAGASDAYPPAGTAAPDTGATPEAPFVLQERQPVCDENLEGPLIQVQVRDSAGQPVPGIEIILLWEGNEENTFTGLRPELGLGYADFAISEEINSYTVQLAAGGEPVTGLAVHECQPAAGNPYWGGWLLEFVQPELVQP